MENEILESFKHLIFLDFNEVNKLLNELDSITKKLNYLKQLKVDYIDKFSKVLNSLQPNKKEFCLKNYEEFKGRYFSHFDVVSPLQIPNFIYENHFKEGLNNPEFTFWFLRYNAKEYFNILKVEFAKEIENPIADKLIKARLKKIDDFEDRVYELLSENKINIKDETYSTDFHREVEFLRIKSDYYKSNPLHYVQGVNETVWLYAEHIYFKNYLKDELRKLEPKSFAVKKDYKETIWFKVGLLFAQGKPQILYKKYKKDKGYFKKITLELGFETKDRPYFSETINNSTTNDKNIYSNPDKLQKIFDYCEENSIKMTPEFIHQKEAI